MKHLCRYHEIRELLKTKREEGQTARHPAVVRLHIMSTCTQTRRCGNIEQVQLNQELHVYNLVSMGQKWLRVG